MEPKMNFYYPMSSSEGEEPTKPTTTDTAALNTITPRTRKEHYLAAIAGENVTIPEPKTPQEHYLKEIAENGGGALIIRATNMVFDEDVSYNDLANAVRDGQIVCIVSTQESGIRILYLNNLGFEDGSYSAFFESIAYASDDPDAPLEVFTRDETKD